MANFDCYVRIYLPLDANGRPKTSDYGHYDLMIKSMGNTPLNFDSHTSVVDPVFSYGGSNNGQGYVKIFNPNKTVNIFTFDMLACTFHFTASSAKVDAFVKQMQKVLTYSSKDSNASTYKVNSNWDYKTFTNPRLPAHRRVLRQRRTRRWADYFDFAVPDFPDEASFTTYVQEAKRRSVVNLPSTAQYGDNLLTLATCSEEGVGGRLVVVCMPAE